MCCGCIVANAHSEKGEISPVDCVEEHPVFDVRIDSCSGKEIDEKTDGLQHQCSLADSQLELLLVVALVSSVNSGEHQTSDEEVKGRCEYGVVICLGESMNVPWLDSKGTIGTSAEPD